MSTSLLECVVCCESQHMRIFLIPLVCDAISKLFESSEHQNQCVFRHERLDTQSAIVWITEVTTEHNIIAHSRLYF